MDPQPGRRTLAECGVHLGWPCAICTSGVHLLHGKWMLSWVSHVCRLEQNRAKAGNMAALLQEQVGECLGTARLTRG